MPPSVREGIVYLIVSPGFTLPVGSFTLATFNTAGGSGLGAGGFMQPFV